MRPLYFPFTHHTWDQPGGHQQSPLTRRTGLPTSPCSSLVLKPISCTPRAGQAGHPPACNLLLRLGQSGSCSPALLLGVETENLPRETRGRKNASRLTLETATPAGLQVPAWEGIWPITCAALWQMHQLAVPGQSRFFPLPHIPSAGRLFQCGSL